MNQQKQTRSFRKFRLFLSFFCGIWISIAIGVCAFDGFEPDDGNSDEEIKIVEDQIDLLALKIDLGEEITWDQIDNFGYVIIDATNRDIAIAKVMMELSEPPKVSNGLDSLILSIRIWHNKVALSQKEWKMYKLSGLYIKSTLAGAGSLILTIPGVWFVLGWMVLIIRFLWRWMMMIIRSIWDFFLDRITELSNAIRGKKETRSS